MRLEHGSYGEQIRNRLFQFHKGAIRTHNIFMHEGDISNFNSIKVRLELCTLADTEVSFYLFQFHKGAIRTQKRTR